MKHFFLPTHRNANIPYSLSRKALISYSVFILAVKILALTYVFLLPNALIKASDVTPGSLISLTNTERTAAGLEALTPNGTLAESATIRANDLLERGAFDHTGCWAAFKSAGYDYRYAGENLAKDFSNSEDIVTAWMNSPTHRANILNANYTEIGIAAVPGLFNGSPTIMVVQHFGTPKETDNTPPEEPAVETDTPPATEPPAEEPPAPEPEPEPEPISQPEPSPEPVPTPPPANTTAPQAPEITFPENNSYHTAISAIRGKAEKNSRVTLYNFDTVIGSTTSASGTFELTPSPALTEGNYKLRAQATDAAENSSELSSAIDITIDSTPPSISSDQTVALVNVSDSSTYVQTVVTDTNLDSVILRFLDNEVSMTLGNAANTYITTINRALTDEARAQIKAIDKSGNSITYTIPTMTVVAAPTEAENKPTTNAGLTFLGQVNTYDNYLILLVAGLVTVFLLFKLFFRRGTLHYQTVIGSLAVIAFASILILI